MSILVIAEHNNQRLNIATLNVITAAQQLGTDIQLLVAGHECSEVVTEILKIKGVSKVYVAEHMCYAHQLAEHVAELLSKFIQENYQLYSHVLTAATTTGKNLLPRVAALCNVEQISDVISIESDTVFKRPIYAGNVIATVQSDADIHMMTVRASAFESATVASEPDDAEVVRLGKVCDMGQSELIGEQQSDSERPELSSAETVVSGGRGMASADNFELLYQLAEKLGAAVGATRAAVDADFAANDMQVGQTGKIVAPQLYIAVGVSGAIQHLAGMKDSKVIAAINKDENAPIFEVADYGLVADLFEVLPQMIEKI